MGDEKINSWSLRTAKKGNNNAYFETASHRGGKQQGETFHRLNVKRLSYWKQKWLRW